MFATTSGVLTHPAAPDDSRFDRLLAGFATPSVPSAPPPIQRSLDDLGRPLVDTTFCVLDFETTGGSPTDDLITEVGAVRVRGGEVLGTFQTLVNPGRAIPPTITVLTGISDSMVVKAPRIEAVLGTLVDFIGDAVVVGHNVRFDLGFLRAALERDERPVPPYLSVDTVTLARKLMAGETPDHRLGTLAARLRLPHRPNHRALDDASATADLLHVLIGRATALGVTGLDDLLALPSVAGHPLVSKLTLTDRLPRRPGVYLFRDAAGRVLYVGKATNLRARVRSYFSTDQRRKVPRLLREMTRVDYKATDGLFEAEVLEIRLIQHLEPPYNRHGTRWRSSAYVRVSTGDRGRVSVVRTAKPSGPGETEALHLGPVPSMQAAKLAAEAITAALPEWDTAAADRAATAVRGAHEVVSTPLAERMSRLAAAERFEEAAAVRDRLEAFADALERTARFERLRSAERLALIDGEGRRIELHRGRLAVIGGGTAARAVEALPPDPGPPGVGPLPARLADELTLVERWLRGHLADLRLVEVQGIWASTVTTPPRFRPRSPGPTPPTRPRRP